MQAQPEPRDEPVSPPAAIFGDAAVCQALFEQMPVSVLLVEVPSGRFIWYNSRAEDMLGHPAIPAEDVQDYSLYSGLHEDGRPYEAHEYPLARVVLDGETIERERIYYRRGDGRVVVWEISAAQVQAPNGRVIAVQTSQDVTAEHSAQRALAEAAERVQLALDAAAIIGTFVWNLTEGLCTMDERCAQAFGLSPERCRAGLTRPEFLATVHPDDRANLLAGIAEALPRGGAFRHQYRVLPKDGEHLWVEASGRVELDEHGKPVRFPGVIMDIAARKQTEDARNLLMREVDHRARNVLAMVQSVVRLTDVSDPHRYQEEVIGRVDAMARAQGSLSRNNWAGGVLEDLVREELSPYASPHQFTIKGPKITLPAGQVQPFSMIVHEMATNAVKYGALSAHGGKVEVFWTATGREFALTWRERGGPAVEPPTRRGFGSRLIARLAAQLDGAIHQEWRAAGLVATLTWRA